MRGILLFLIGIIFGAASTHVAGNAEAGTQDHTVTGGQATLAKAVVERISRLGNLDVTYTERVEYPRNRRLATFTGHLLKLAEKNHPGIHVAGSLSRYSYHCRFSLLGERVFYQQVMDDRTVADLGAPGGPHVGVIRLTRTSTHERAESLAYQLTQKHRPLGEIQVKAPPSRQMYFAAALGLRGASTRHWDWIGPRRIGELAIRRIGGGRFSVVQQLHGGYTYRWEYAYAPEVKVLSLSVLLSHGRYKNLLCAKVQCSGFRSIGGVQLPEHIEETFFAPPISRNPTEEVVLSGFKYAVGSPHNTPSRYQILFPKGSAVMDERIDRVFHIKRPTRLSDKEIFTRLKARDAAAPR